jgi:hypothetical protein
MPMTTFTTRLACRLHAASVHYGECDLRLDQEFARALHKLAEHDARAADFNHFRAGRDQLIQARGAVIFHRQARHHELHPALLGEAREVDARRVEELGARALHEGEVLRMEHHPAGIGVLVIDPDRDRQLSDRRSRAADGATIPKWRYAESVAMRPRGVRCR